MNDTLEWEHIHRSRHWGVYPDVYMVRQVKAFLKGRNLGPSVAHRGFPAAFLSDAVAKPKALDIGCGAGAHALMMLAEGMDVTAFDSSPTAIERMAKLGMQGRVMTVQEAEFPNASFDFILDNLTLTNVEHPPWDRITRWLKPGGWLVWASFEVQPQGSPQTWLHDHFGEEVERQMTLRDGRWSSLSVRRYVAEG